MRGAWLNLSEEPNVSLLAKHDITDVCFDIRDPRLSRAYLAQVQGLGFVPGVYAASQGEGWPDASRMSGALFAEWVEARVKPLNRSQNVPFVHLNCETHDVPWLVDMLTRWRELRPAKRTLLTLEGMQGGLFSPSDVAAIEAANVEYGPQAYTGAMDRMESATIVYDLIARGFSADRIHVFLDGAQLGVWWQGWAFVQSRLP